MHRTSVFLVGSLLALGCGDNIKLDGDGGPERNDAAPFADGGLTVFPADPENYSPGRVSYISTISVPEVDDDGPLCCADFGSRSEDDGIDNAYAEFANTAKMISALLDFDIEYDELLARNPNESPLVWLFDHRGLAFDKSDQFTLALLYGFMDGDTTQPDAQGGSGTFTIDTRSFETGTGTPKSFFEGAFFNSDTGGVFTPLRKIFVPFALANSQVQIPLSQARIRGTAIPRRTGVTYSRGEISGYILLDDFFEALNATVASQCQCLNDVSDFNSPIFSKNNSGDWIADCPGSGAEVETDCGGSPENNVCIAIAGSPANGGGACGLISLIATNQVDIDTDGDGEYDDAFSFGLEFTAVEGEIVDVSN